ncbi:ankyrin repeat-containing domain protein [Lophiotrema nucula]|uniref:Ankyrin repeat-containing domain protein n=1 Tax=Lophiotrema nucula TaxID=690887 RepID=A0A6A5Z0A3_9PLEO|nr:ankyrin repeat-containing domain protein [Lophiotrema nucula]
MAAAEAGRNEATKTLIANGSHLDARDKLGWTALMRAAEACSQGVTEGVTRTLVEEGALLDLKNAKGWTSIMLAVRNAGAKVTRILSHGGASLYHNTPEGQPLLHYLAETDSWQRKSQFDCAATLSLLLDLGLPLENKDVKGWTALMSAANRCNRSMVKLLLEKGADINATAADERTSLINTAANYDPRKYYACSTDVLELLVNNRASLDAKDVNGKTALIYAAMNGFLEAVNSLLRAGAQVNAKDLAGLTPLMCASLVRWDETVETPWWHPLARKDIVQRLLDRGAILDATDKRGWTAVMCAADGGDVHMVKFLFDRGAILEEEFCCTPEMRETWLKCMEEGPHRASNSQ